MSNAGNVKQKPKDATGGMTAKNVSAAYDMIRNKDFAGLKGMLSSGSATSEFFKYFSVKALANTDEHNSSAGAVPQLMQLAGFGKRELLETAKNMAERKIQNSKLDKAQNYVFVVMELVEEVGTREEHAEAIRLRDRVEFLKTEASKKEAALEMESKSKKGYDMSDIPWSC